MLNCLKPSVTHDFPLRSYVRNDCYVSDNLQNSVPCKRSMMNGNFRECERTYKLQCLQLFPPKVSAPAKPFCTRRAGSQQCYWWAQKVALAEKRQRIESQTHTEWLKRILKCWGGSKHLNLFYSFRGIHQTAPGGPGLVGGNLAPNSSVEIIKI